MNSNTINENIVTAMDILISKRLEQLKYNVTKICMIIDNTHKQLGRYTVQEEIIQYDAYSTNTNLNNGEFVLVMIPNGDYNEQKIILNKVVNDNDLTSSVAYVSPLKTMLSFTGNIIEKDNIQPALNSNAKNGKYFSLLANGDNSIGLSNPEVQTSKLLYSIPWSNYNNYERIGISADFQSWLKDLGANSGEYGLEFLFFTSNASLLDQENKEATYRFTFSTNDILGDPYNFPMYFTQEKVIDISQLKDISLLNIYFYQKGNFKDDNSEYILSQFENAKLPDNIFVGNIKLYVGYDINQYTSDTVVLTTQKSLTYSEFRDNENNKRDLSLHWVHKLDENNYEIIDGNNIGDKEIEIYWVRYNTDSDPVLMDIVGPNWTYSESELQVNPVDKFQSTLLINKDNLLVYNETIKIKAICRIKDNHNWLQYESNILTFTTEDASFDAETYNAVMGLSIGCNDGGYHGNYFIYGNDNKIIDESKGSGYYREFQLYYDGVTLDKSVSIPLDNIENVTWTLPVNKDSTQSVTMLNYPQIKLNECVIDNNKIQYSTNTNSTLEYSIANIWYPNIAENTISCTLRLKNGEVYKASKALLFGKANSQGSNYNLVIDYEENQTAYELITDEQNKINKNKIPSTRLIGRLYNLSGLVTEPNGTWKWSILEGMSSSESSTFTITPEKNGNVQTNKAIIQFKNSISTLALNCAIVKLEFKPADNSTPIITYKPIAIKTKRNDTELERCHNMAGATQITYLTSGSPQYYAGAYILYDENNKDIIYDGTTVSKSVVWSIPKECNSSNESGYPTIKLYNKITGKNNAGTNVDVSYYALSADPIYINGNNYTVCVVAKVDGVIYWIQPIEIIHSRYELAIVNDWDGTTTINNEDSIAAATIAVGKKDTSNGSFSGIVLGELESKLTSGTVKSTGLYGIANEMITFSLTDMGLASFGKITPDKENINIQFGPTNFILSHSSPVHNNGQEVGCKEHFLCDFDNREIILQADSSKTQELAMSASGKSYLKFTSVNNNTMLDFGNDNNGNEKFLLSSDGASDSTGLTFNVKDGIMKLRPGAYIELNSSSNYIGKKNNDDNLLKIGKFIINKDGEATYDGKTLAKYIEDIVSAMDK